MLIAYIAILILVSFVWAFISLRIKMKHKKRKPGFTKEESILFVKKR